MRRSPATVHGLPFIQKETVPASGMMLTLGSRVPTSPCANGRKRICASPHCLTPPPTCDAVTQPERDPVALGREETFLRRVPDLELIDQRVGGLLAVQGADMDEFARCPRGVRLRDALRGPGYELPVREDRHLRNRRIPGAREVPLAAPVRGLPRLSPKDEASARRRPSRTRASCQRTRACACRRRRRGQAAARGHLEPMSVAPSRAR